MDFFEFFTALAALYGVFCLWTGETSGRFGVAWSTYTRTEHPGRYWTLVLSYIAIGVFGNFVLPMIKAG